MRKIGLCICYSVKNYGSMLQAYATQQYVSKVGLDYEIIRYSKKHNIIFYFISCLKLFNSNFRKEVFRRLFYKVNLIKNSELNHNISIRNSKFTDFEKTNFFNLSNICTTYSELQNKGKEFPAYLVGSDQLWLPAGLSTNFYNLNFTADSAMRISYATSFGVSKIPSYQKKRTASFLRRIDYLSVREKKGVELVAEIAGKKAELVVDPTLLLTVSDWEKYIPRTDSDYGEYIFVYFIGNNSEHRDKVEQLKRKTGLKVVALIHIDEFIPTDEKLYDLTPFDVGPAEFVNLIRNAKYICTDSFHGSVFSIIHEKPFVVFNRFSENTKNSTNSRISSLCSILGLNDRRVSKDSDIIKLMENEIQYDEVNKKIQLLRESSIKFINSALDRISDK